MPFDGAISKYKPPGFLARLRTALAPTAKTLTPAPSALFAPEPPPPSNDPVVQVLTIGRALIEDRKNWVQRRYETRDGRRCAMGALRGACRSLNLPRIPDSPTNALLAVAQRRGFNDIESMNDNSSHRQVLSAFDEAIADARG